MAVGARRLVVSAVSSFDWFPDVRRPGQAAASDVSTHLLPTVRRATE